MPIGKPPPLPRQDPQKFVPFLPRPDCVNIHTGETGIGDARHAIGEGTGPAAACRWLDREAEGSRRPCPVHASNETGARHGRYGLPRYSDGNAREHLSDGGMEVVIARAKEGTMSEVVYGLIHEAKGRYGISFPDFPGCVAAGETPDEALRRGAETLRFHIAGMMDDGEALPKLRGLSELQRTKAFKSHAKGAGRRRRERGASRQSGPRQRFAGRASA